MPWTPPATSQGEWTVNQAAGTPGGTGIPGGIDQYLAGGVNDRAVTGTVHNVTASPYFVAPNNNQTTGTIVEGTALLTVANATGFEVGNYIRCGAAAAFSTIYTTVQSGSSSSGIVTITLDTGSVPVSVTSGSSASVVASAIRAASFTGYVTGGTGTTVTFKATSAGYKGEPSVAAGGTGVSTTNGISLYESRDFRVLSKSGNELTLSQVVDVGATGGTVTHNASIGVQAAWLAAVSGDVIYFPPGTYRFESRALYMQGKDNITIRGAGSSSTTWVIATTQSVFQLGSPGIPNQSPKIVTGTKAKGTRTLTVDETSLYTAGDHVSIAYENEVNNARIQAGAPPVWTSLGWPEARRMYARVTGKTATTVTIDPALPADATNLALTIYRYSLAGQNWITSGIGFEGISVSYASSSHPPAVIAITAAEYCWVYDVKFLNWSMNTANGSAIGIGDSYRCEIRKCVFTAAPNVSSDGAIGIGSLTSSAIYDNIFTGGWGTWIYDNGNSFNNVYAYNYAPELGSDLHNAHPMLNLIEGNFAYNHVSDGYHGSSSDNTIYGNYFYGGGTGQAGWYSLMLHRFKRRYAVARNFFGQDGVSAGRILWGQPNFNLFANGFAGPTGLSNQVGQVDVNQPGYAPFTYVIQAGDVAAGDFWSDWETSATLTTRVSNTVGIFTVSGGTWFTGDGVTGGQIWPRVWWDNKAGGLGSIGQGDAGTVTNVSGNLVTISWGAGTLPPQGTVVQLYQGPGGWQERDLDVQASSTYVHNYFAAGTGTGAIQNSSGDTFSASLAWSAKPPWVGSKPWPVFDVDSAATAVASRLPAAHRFLNGNEDYLGGASTPQYSPAPGLYPTAQTVTITTGSPAPYTIYYTLDGSTPTTSSLVYSAPITLPGTTTVLKAITVKSGLSDSSVQSGTYTIGSAPTAPTAPTSLSATAVSSSQINLTWTDNANNETEFKIERKVGAGGSWNEIYTAAANATSYSVTGLSPSTQYFFRVRAGNVTGYSGYTNEANATTSPTGTLSRRRSARFPRKSILVTG